MDRSNIIRIHECKLSKNGDIIPPVDGFSRQVLANLKTTCEAYDKEELIKEIPYQPASTLPFHNVYLAFYAGSYGVAMILQYAVTYAITKEEKYGYKAKAWLLSSITWDEERFSLYCSSRLMHAIIAGVDWIQDLLSDDEIERAYGYIRKLCLHHEEQAMSMITGKETGGHANLYASCFGLACLALISADMEPKARDWLKAVIGKFKTNLFPHDVKMDGTYQPDGNWCIEYAFRYKFIFLDALRLVTGEDLIKEYQEDLIRPLRYLKYAYMGDGQVPVKDIYGPNENMLDVYQINTCGSLFLRFASFTRDPYLQWIGMSNPVAGRTNAFGNRVKGGHRFLYPVGYSDYLWYDPSVEPQFTPPEELAKLFPVGELAILRTRYGNGLTLAYQGRRGNVMYESPDLIVNKNGRSMFCKVPVKDSLPLSEANGPAAGGGEMERKGVIEKLIQLGEKDILRIKGFLTRQQITFSREDESIDITVSRRKRNAKEASLQHDVSGQYLRLRGEGYLQYDAPNNFNPDQGVLQMEFRLSRKPSKSEKYPAVLFSIGQHLKYTFGNAMFIGFLEEGRLGVKFKDSEGRWLFAHLSSEVPAINPGYWYFISVYWNNLNTTKANPICGIVIGEYHAEARLTMPNDKAFHCIPNTTMWVGGSVQMPDSFANADIRMIKIYGKCHQGFTNGRVPNERDLLFETDYRKGMNAVYAKGKGEEIAEAGLEYRFHAQECEGKQVIVHKDYVQILNEGESVYIVGKDVEIQTETLPYLRSGFAGLSFEEEPNQPISKRIVIIPREGQSNLNFQIITKRPEEN
ncbi:hypothetical protein ACFPYJ_00385 [Paenibacillus solisilvae]|uniref:DUF4962 domain-containing protein n=1 Tax=Paenibacillus solisilvae TaxID=2486751 RepID=A0ABW0VST6_9BACL